MARLSVNLNKIALLRNSRRTGVPDIGDFARLAHDAGADGLTVHPRPDERHIRANGIEIYTGSYAAACRAGNAAAALHACAATAARAAALGLVVNAGHDLNLDNLPALVAAMPSLAEASIGHELTADALVIGFAAAVRAYKAALAV